MQEARLLFLGLLASVSFLFVAFSYHDAHVFPDIFIKIAYEGLTLTILSVVLAVILAEAMARLTCREMCGIKNGSESDII